MFLNSVCCVLFMLFVLFNLIQPMYKSFFVICIRVKSINIAFFYKCIKKSFKIPKEQIEVEMPRKTEDVFDQ